MAKMDWEAAKCLRRRKPLLTDGMIKEFRQDAEQLAKRVKKRRKQTGSSTGRTLGPEEKAVVAQKMGWTIADQKLPTTTESMDHHVPWWSDDELAAGKKGIAPEYDSGQNLPSRNVGPHPRKQCKRGHWK